MAQDAFKHRYRMFLDILWPVMCGWNDALAGEGGIDFEDMLNMAADYVEQGKCSPRYRLVSEPSCYFWVVRLPDDCQK